MSSHYSYGLNEAQLKAVQHPPDVPLQILAGPGSGKTKVLTSRISHLISCHNIPPACICAVTFTNKAANEMRERLILLIGKEATNQIKLGTFHSICAMFLRKHARRVGLKGNFTVCDTDESNKLVKKLMEPYKDLLLKQNATLKEATGTALSLISKAKANGQTAKDLLAKYPNRLDVHAGTGGTSRQTGLTSGNLDRIAAEVYDEYERALRRSNSLDFDDLLVFGVKLFDEHPTVGEWCRHVFVDEFQDTNVIQYELMQRIAAGSKSVTVVGDPDQSIFGWRSAEIENLARMRRDFPRTEQILLEQNYRSTGSILAASVAILSQDRTRVPKRLYTTHPNGPNPVLRAFQYDNAEAAFIASEIKRLVAFAGGMLGWSDFVVLLRSSSLSRPIESALQKEGIPNRVLAGHKFFERLEVKDLLAYLQLVDNPSFVPAFRHVINVPSRGIGEKTITELLSAADRLKISPVQVTERIYDGIIPDIRPPVKRKLSSFLPAIRRLRDLADNGMSPSDLLRHLLESLDWKTYLRKTQPDWEGRWDNVQELINFASEVKSTSLAEADKVHSEAKWDMSEQFDRKQLDDEGIAELGVRSIVEDKVKAKQIETPLRAFLQASMLSSDAGTQANDGGTQKVTISTCHAAKGLEWPVVMIPAVEKGIFPSFRADDIDEERRLLYVACTRAQCLLYLSYSTSRMVSGEIKKKELSEFLTPVQNSSNGLFTGRLPDLTKADRVFIAQLLGRDLPNELESERRMAEYKRTTKPGPWDDLSDQPGHNLSSQWRRSVDAHDASGSVAFRSTKETFSSVLPKLTAQPVTGSVQPFTSSSRDNVTAVSSTLTQLRSHISPEKPPVVDLHPSNLSSQPSARAQQGDPASSGLSASSITLAGGKRRLGMGRTGVGYSNKKFKAPGS